LNPLKKLAGQTAIYGLPTIIGRFLNYLLVPLFTYNITKSDYGVVNEMYAYVSFIIILLTGGMETALFRYSVKEELSKDKVYSTALVWVIMSSLLLMLPVLLFHAQIISLLGLCHTCYMHHCA
jgi:O-antigen/teichoic acid export membrane protein